MEIPEMPAAFKIEQATLHANCKNQVSSISITILEDGTIDIEKLKEDWERIRNSFWNYYAASSIKTIEEYNSVLEGN